MVGQLRTIRGLLWALSAALTVAVIVSATLFARTDPLEIGPQAEGASGKLPAGQAQATETDAGGIDPSVWRRDYRRALYDAAPAGPPPAPKLPVQLRGTVTEPGFSYAILEDQAGKSQFVRIGQTFAGVKLIAIEAGSVTVEFSGRTLTLRTKEST
jgi:hypothetical protein